MSESDATDEGRRPRVGTVRRVFGYVVALVAAGLTVALSVAVFQAITGDFVGGEVEIVWTIVAFVGVVTAGAWAIAVAVMKAPGKREQKTSNQP